MVDGNAATGEHNHVHHPVPVDNAEERRHLQLTVLPDGMQRGDEVTELVVSSQSSSNGLQLSARLEDIVEIV